MLDYMGIRQRFRFIRSLAQLCEWQGLLVQAKDEEMSEMRRVMLANAQAQRDLAVAWRVTIESPEIDVRDDLDALIRDLSDQVSKMEEMIV